MANQFVANETIEPLTSQVETTKTLDGYKIVITTPDGRQVDVSEHVTEISLIGTFPDEVIRVIEGIRPLLARNTQKATFRTNPSPFPYHANPKK